MGKYIFYLEKRNKFYNKYKLFRFLHSKKSLVY